ncbi:hypothetical protein [Streptomyces adustus]|uniref:hypothetical protein n=1 Tax=Streptomyces adustus TaxID=1609272 RepID=UPI00371536A6
MTPHQAFRPLLHALALAQGRGLPVRDGIRSTIAAAIAPQQTSIIDRAISDLTSEAMPYLMLDTEADRTVYRLAHRTFTEHFAQFGQEHERLHQGSTAALTTDADLRLPEAELNPYVAQHLAAARQFHAREGHLIVPRKAVAIMDGVEHKLGRGSTTPAAGRPSSARNAVPNSISSACAGPRTAPHGWPHPARRIPWIAATPLSAAAIL